MDCCWRESLETMALKWSQLKFVFLVPSHIHGGTYFSRRIDPQSSSILGLLLSQTRAALSPHFPAHSAPNRDEETWAIQLHADEPRWDASDMHMADGATNDTGILPPSNVTQKLRRNRPTPREPPILSNRLPKTAIWCYQKINPLWFKTAQNGDIKPHTIPWAQERASEQVSKEVNAAERTSNASNVGRT